MAAEYWFKFNGVSSETYGIIVTEQPRIVRPKERVALVTVPGRAGRLTVTEGDNVFDPIDLTAKCVVTNADRLDDIYAWLSGEGDIEFACRPGGVYRGRLSKQVEATRLANGAEHRQFALTFTCQPFWRPLNQQDIVLTASGATITNPGNVPSVPQIRVYGSGNISLTLDGTVNIEELETGILLDWEMGDAISLDGGTLLNHKVDGGPQAIPAGTSKVFWTGDVDQVVITPNWRSL